MSGSEDLYKRENALMETSVVRMVDTKPSDFRVAVYPDGSKKVQAGFFWYEGFQSGMEWRELPVVQVNEQGKEILNA